ncbi:uncharacterized protein si:ch73-204p21.2 isoform X2 [Thalassophryne amazonica]|uniref:uncharacterized protein si:ch73-204p21.2 isoform X2 n=1 Tax=Thalassophryne amazonica TaxID=390379 RepID=UPI00147253EA|nr:uncharacterized protein si:ch73-204p21.2 isoform X2 [Thalassophryne amazonica]
MAPVGAEVSGSFLLSSDVIILFVLLLLLSVFLAALCTDCIRHSFELQDAKVEKHPSVLINVVKLEDSMTARENPVLHEIQSDEKDVQTNGSTAGKRTGSDSDTAAESNEDENSISFIPWRSHLVVSQPHAPPLTSTSSDSTPIYHVVGATQSETLPPSLATNHKPAPTWHSEDGGDKLNEDVRDTNSRNTYARIDRKEKSPTPLPVRHTKEEQWAESSPPLPNRKAVLET